MDKRRNKKYSNNWNNQKKSDQQAKDSGNKQKTFQFNKSQYEDHAADAERQKAIQEVKARVVVCAACGQPINDIANAMVDKTSGNPIHFDCAIEQVRKSEAVGENEKISYIGQGRFAVLYYENPRDQRHFTIKKIIEWESKEQKSEWREELSNLYSKVN